MAHSFVTRFLFLPPIDAQLREYADRLRHDVPDIQVDIVERTEDLANALPNAQAAYGWIPPTVLPHADSLKWLQNPFAGPFVGYYYEELCNPRGIYSDHIAHHVLMFMLALSRGLPYWMEAQRQRRWDRKARKSGYVDIAESTVLINGCGGIGRETAPLCTEMGARTIAIDPRPEGQMSGDVFPPVDLEEHPPHSDFVVSTVPHTPETERMWNLRRFKLMKSSAYFINVGRGMTAVIDDLATALEKSEIAGAGLDVFETEPLPEDHVPWSLEKGVRQMLQSLGSTGLFASSSTRCSTQCRVAVDQGGSTRIVVHPVSQKIYKRRWYLIVSKRIGMDLWG